VRYVNQTRKPSKSHSRGDGLVYEFGPFRIDVTERMLFRNRVPVPLTSKAFDTLLALVRNSGRVVNKHDLMKSVWPDTVVEENNLNQSVSAIRKALGNALDGDPYIETVPRRGYRFVSQVTATWDESSTAGRLNSIPDHPAIDNPREPSPQRTGADSGGVANNNDLESADTRNEDPSRASVTTSQAVFHRTHRRWLLAATGSLLIASVLVFNSARPLLHREANKQAAGVPSLTQGRYLAVLPFRVIDDAPSLNYAAEGLAGALSAAFMDSHGVYVASAPAVDRAKPNAPFASTASQLGVNLLVVGTIQGSAENLQIHVSLEDVAAGRSLWSGDFSGTTRDIFTLEDDIYSKLAAALEIPVSEREAERRSTHTTESLQAYDLYLRGKDALRQRQQLKNVEAAVRFQQEALEIDPGFALAYAGLADACLEMYRQQKDNFWAEKALNAAQQAVRLNDSVAEVHFVLGSVYRVTGKLDDAVVEEKRGLAFAPRSDEGYRRLGQALLDAGEAEEALQAYEKAVQINPYYWFNFSALGEAYFRLAKYEEALAAFRRVIELEPDNAYGHDNVGAVYLCEGRWSDAIPEYERALRLEPHFVAYSNLGTAYFDLKRYHEAAKMFEQAVAISPNQQAVLGNLADAYRWSGESAKAAATYDKAIALAYRELQVNPRKTTAMQGLALYYAKKGNGTQALEFIRRARSLDPNNVEFAYAEAEVLALAGNAQQALEALREALRMGYPPKDAAVDPELRSLQRHPQFRQMMAEGENSKT
jgi:tetratricopeptide (TPR) repeat protein/DNA-binding winged helix-turn-helix (wHTH) protein